MTDIHMKRRRITGEIDLNTTLIFKTIKTVQPNLGENELRI